MYRYALSRAWGEGPMVTWVCLNPSTADATTDDATIRTMLGFSRLWGMGSLTVVNLYAFRSVDPRDLATATDPVGPGNEEALLEWICAAHVVVAGWGAHRGPGLPARVAVVRGMAAAAGRDLQCLGRNSDGSPKHPLYLARATPLVPWT